jgi:hypothetical protein
MKAIGGILLTVGLMAGCNPSGVTVQTYQVKPLPAMDQAKQTLQRYVDGAPLGSEVMGFPHLVEEVKKTDAAKGAILEQGLADLQKSPNSRVEKAKALLKQL